MKADKWFKKELKAAKGTLEYWKEYAEILEREFAILKEGIPAETLVVPQGELLPCPFCMGEAAFGTMRFGCETVKQQKWERETFHFINCIKCGANNKCLERGYATKEKAAEHWNTRYDKHNKFIEFNKLLNTVYENGQGREPKTA